MSAAQFAAARLAPVTRPFDASVQMLFDAVTPTGREPLLLFRTLARAPRVYQRMHAGGLLDPGTLTLKQRELVILRVCARHQCEYEWGVHVTLFARRAGFSNAELLAILTGENEVFEASESVLLQTVEQVDQTTRLDDRLWQELAGYFAAEQILEILALSGFYRTICIYANALQLAPEAFAARFQDVLDPESHRSP